MHILMTGVTQGFGLFAAERLIGAGHRLTVGARSPGAVPDKLKDGADVRLLDLDSLQSVRDFAAGIADAGPIDALVLNAGLQLAKPATSVDGFERTFAVNHLAHYLLLRLLEGQMASGGRIVLTGSGTHDPAEGTPVTPPVHANAEWLAYPDRDPTAEQSNRKACFRAYSTSKLANIMTAREAAKRYPALSVMSFDPGYVPWTGLGRDNGRVIAALVSFILPKMMKGDRSSTIERSGGFLADLASASAYSDCHDTYWSVRGPALRDLSPSELARDDAAAAKLWDDSAGLVGLAAAVN